MNAIGQDATYALQGLIDRFDRSADFNRDHFDAALIQIVSLDESALLDRQTSKAFAQTVFLFADSDYRRFVLSHEEFCGTLRQLPASRRAAE